MPDQQVDSSQRQARGHDLIPVAVGLAALATASAGNWDRFQSFFGTGLASVVIGLTLYYAFLHSLRRRLHPGCLLTAYGIVVAAGLYGGAFLFHAMTTV